MPASRLSAKLPFLAFASLGEVAVLRAFANSQGFDASCIHEGDIASATLYLKEHPSPDVLLVELPSAEGASSLIDALADMCDEGTKVIITGHINEYSFYCWLMDAGIFSYLLKPLTPVMLADAYRKSQAQHAQALAPERTQAQVIAVTGSRGGVGASTLALNLAGYVAHQGKRVALIETDPQDGSIALSLDIEPSHGIREALERPERIDGLFLERVFTKIGTHLHVLSAEESLQEMLSPHEQAFAMLLAALKEQFEVIVFDVPRQRAGFSQQALSATNQVVLVSDASILGLRDTLRISDMLRQVLKLPAPVVVVNKLGFAPKQALPLADFEKGVGMKAAAAIAFAPELFMSLGVDIAVVKMPAHAASKAVAHVAEILLPEIVPPASPTKRWLNLLGKPKAGV